MRNRLLSAASPGDLSALQPHLETVQLGHDDVLFEPGAPIEYVYFPETAVISLVTSLTGKATIETGTVGHEGIAGLPVFLGDTTSTILGVTQIPGRASRIRSDTFSRLADGDGTLHGLLLRYTQAFLIQVAQTAACNATHRLDQRCARWLLMMRERVEGDDFPLTHKAMAFMLGVRRSGVTVAMHELKEAGLIRYTRAAVTLVDVPGLEKRSCECYGVVRSHFDRLLNDGTSG
jgi:CRP-like cAMP-binding protein